MTVPGQHPLLPEHITPRRGAPARQPTSAGIALATRNRVWDNNFITHSYRSNRGPNLDDLRYALVPNSAGFGIRSRAKGLAQYRIEQTSLLT